MKTRSPFGAYAYSMCANRRVKLNYRVSLEGTEPESADDSEESQAGASGEDENPYYNIEFLEYLLKEIFPYAPLLNQSLFYAAEIHHVTGDTNAPGRLYLNPATNHIPTLVAMNIDRYGTSWNPFQKLEAIS